MGKAINKRLKVKGMQKPRVVDVSVFLKYISRNIIYIIYTATEKGIDLIKNNRRY